MLHTTYGYKDIILNVKTFSSIEWGKFFSSIPVRLEFFFCLQSGYVKNFLALKHFTFGLHPCYKWRPYNWWNKVKLSSKFCKEPATFVFGKPVIQIFRFKLAFAQTSTVYPSKHSGISWRNKFSPRRWMFAQTTISRIEKTDNRLPKRLFSTMACLLQEHIVSVYWFSGSMAMPVSINVGAWRCNSFLSVYLFRPVFRAHCTSIHLVWFRVFHFFSAKSGQHAVSRRHFFRYS